MQRRRYAPDESALLEELFGEPSRYGDTLKPMLWTHVAADWCRRSSTKRNSISPIPCSYDFEVAAHKYLASLQRRHRFRSTLLVQRHGVRRRAGGVTPEFVPWSCEARYALPVARWREALDAFFPNSAWIRVNRDLFDELRRFKIATGLPTWDAALERLCELAKAKPMNPLEPALDVANAVLYEGYILYPYTASAPKNRIRWQFGVVVPEAYAAQGTGEPAEAQTEMLLESGDDTEVDGRWCASCRSRRAGSKFAAGVASSGRVARASTAGES